MTNRPKIGTGHRFRDARMYIYYVGMIGVGALGFTGDSSPSVSNAIGQTSTTWLFSAGLIVLAVGAIVARRLHAAEGEASAVIGIGLATVVHGVSLLASGSTGWQTGLRLLIPILMMWDWADYRRLEGDLNSLVNRTKDQL